MNPAEEQFLQPLFYLILNNAGILIARPRATLELPGSLFGLLSLRPMRVSMRSPLLCQAAIQGLITRYDVTPLILARLTA